MPRVVHFEISVDDPERAVKFYTEVFGWQVKKWEGPMDYWLIKTGEEGEPGIDGAIARRQHPNERIQNTVNVKNIDKFVKKIEKNGGTIYVPKMAVPGIGWLVYFTDTEGNLHGIMESDMSAK